MKFKLTIIAILATISLQAFASPQPKLLIDRDEKIAAAAKITAENYPNSDEVQVDDYTLAQYEISGLDVVYSDTYVKLLTEKACRENQSQRYNFTLPYDEINVTLIEIIKPDGSMKLIDVAAQSKEMVDRSQMGSNIYNPNSKILSVGVPGLEVGDLLHIVLERKLNKTRMPDSWSDYQVFEYYNPIKHAVYEVHAPLEKPLEKIALKDEILDSVTFSQEDKEVTLAGGKSEVRRVYRWEVNNIPRIYAEPDMPNYYTVVQRLLVSTNPSWESVSSWYWNLCEPHLVNSELMKEKVAQLVAGISDDSEKIRAIFKFVSQDIRYLGITVEDTAPGYEPHSAQMTFDNRHGVCRDKAALLVALLREAGFEAFPVLIYSGPKKDREVPQPYFNHAISAVRKPDGTFLLMDSTDESTKELLPEYLNDCSYLVATPQGEDLLVSPILPASKNMLTIVTDAKIDEKGNYSAKSDIEFNGINDNVYRGYFARITHQQRREYFESLVGRIIPGAKLKSFSLFPKDMLNTDESIKVTIDYEASDVLIGGEGDSLLPIFAIGNRVGIVNFVLGKTGLKERRFPLETGYACGVSEQLTLEIDEKLGSILSVPKYQIIDNESIAWKKELVQNGSTITGQSEFVVKVVRFEPQQYLELKKSLKDIEFNERKMAIIDSGSYLSLRGQSDVVYKSIDKNYTIQDENNWSVRVKVAKEILTYKGKKDSSELKFDYNPAWEEVNLISAKVLTAGEVKEISDQEMNLMDAAWSGSAPRYPSAKTLVASLPAVEIGSVVEYEYERIYKNRPFFEMQETFASFDAIDKKTLTLSYPTKFEYKLRSLVDSNGFAVQGENQDIEIYEIKESSDNITTKQITVVNQLGIKREISLPPMMAHLPTVRVSSGDWKKYCNEINNKLKSSAKRQKLAAKKARGLTRNKKTAQDKVIAIRDFVAKKIRTVGVTLNSLPLSAMSKADTTLTDAYGNTSDKAILIYSMLKSVGVDCEFVLVSRNSRIDELENVMIDLPSKNQFPMVLVKVEISGKEYYLNDTNEYAHLGSSSSWKYLTMNLDHSKVGRVELSDEDKTSAVKNLDITIDLDGSGHVKVRVKNYGLSFAENNKRYSEMRPEEKLRHYQELVAQLSQSSIATSELETDFVSYPGEVSYSLDIDRFAVIDGDYMYITLPKVFDNVLGIKSGSREAPFYNPSFVMYKTVMKITVPKEYSKLLLAPESSVRAIPSNGGLLTIDVNLHGDSQLELVYEMRLAPAIIDAQDYSELFDITRWQRHSENRSILLSK